MSDPDPGPLLKLRVRSTRLELRLPTEAEVQRLAQVAIDGVHEPGVMPFLVPWTDEVGSPTFVERFCAYHRETRAQWSPEAWHLELGVWAGGQLIGVQAVSATDFSNEQTVRTGSWLGRCFHGQGYGTEMRAAVLDLAFAGLGAVAAWTGAFEDNLASAAVSRKLGYAEEGVRRPLVRGIPVRERLFILRRAQWESARRPPAELDGVMPCLPLFGAG